MADTSIWMLLLFFSSSQYAFTLAAEILKQKEKGRKDVAVTVVCVILEGIVPRAPKLGSIISNEDF